MRLLEPEGEEEPDPGGDWQGREDGVGVAAQTHNVRARPGRSEGGRGFLRARPERRTAAFLLGRAREGDYRPQRSTSPRVDATRANGRAAKTLAARRRRPLSLPQYCMFSLDRLCTSTFTSDFTLSSAAMRSFTHVPIEL